VYGHQEDSYSVTKDKDISNPCRVRDLDHFLIDAVEEARTTDGRLKENHDRTLDILSSTYVDTHSTVSFDEGLCLV
jgi:hypothetical protein